MKIQFSDIVDWTMVWVLCTLVALAIVAGATACIFIIKTGWMEILR